MEVPSRNQAQAFIRCGYFMTRNTNILFSQLVLFIFQHIPPLKFPNFLIFLDCLDSILIEGNVMTLKFIANISDVIVT